MKPLLQSCHRCSNWKEDSAECDLQHRPNYVPPSSLVALKYVGYQKHCFDFVQIKKSMWGTV